MTAGDYTILPQKSKKIPDKDLQTQSFLHDTALQEHTRIYVAAPMTTEEHFIKSPYLSNSLRCNFSIDKLYYYDWNP